MVILPDIEPGKRPKPEVVENIPQLKEKRTINLQAHRFMDC